MRDFHLFGPLNNFYDDVLSRSQFVYSGKQLSLSDMHFFRARFEYLETAMQILIDGPENKQTVKCLENIVTYIIAPELSKSPQ